MWGAGAPGWIRVRGRRVEAKVYAEHGPGAVVVEGLAPDAVNRLEVHHESSGARVELDVRTLAPPPGRLLAKVATVSDLHIGSRSFGLLHTMTEPLGVGGPHALVCARAALEEATAWGPDLLVVKGDLTNRGRREEWAQVNELLSGLGVPVLAAPGNHDTWSFRHEEPARAFGVADGRFADPLVSVDLPGVRVVLADSCVPGRAHGAVGRFQANLLDAAAEAAGPTLVGLHHPFDRRRPRYPPGVPAPEADAFLAALGKANGATLVTSGHTHRNRRRRHGPLTLTEVAAVKDHPGVWAGYAVHEGGVRQVVRRVADPAAMVWTEYCRWAVGGLWGAYSPGSLAARCFTLRWPRRTR
ncbi:MAG: metallophosphoesterase family protein [Acidimicrobiales bacterium]